MNNATWACFSCREAVRRPAYTLSTVPCPTCGEAMGYLGDRIRIPARQRIKAWAELHRSICESPSPITKTPDWLRSWHIRRLEREISRLEAAPVGATRAARIDSYRKQLAGYVKSGDASVSGSAS